MTTQQKKMKQKPVPCQKFRTVYKPFANQLDPKGGIKELDPYETMGTKYGFYTLTEAQAHQEAEERNRKVDWKHVCPNTGRVPVHYLNLGKYKITIIEQIMEKGFQALNLTTALIDCVSDLVGVAMPYAQHGRFPHVELTPEQVREHIGNIAGRASPGTKQFVTQELAEIYSQLCSKVCIKFKKGELNIEKSLVRSMWSVPNPFENWDGKSPIKLTVTDETVNQATK